MVIVGSGWAGFKMLENIDQKKWDVIVISPRNYFVFTPLLASTCVGTLEFRAIVEPIRRQGALLPGGKDASLTYYEAGVSGIDFLTKRVTCTSTLEGKIDNFTVGYDKLIIACGAVSNTFNTPGVEQYAHFLKDVHDARRIRYRIMECFEKASQPNVSLEKQKQLLHFVTVGGGPTGIEFSAELYDLITEDLKKLYPHLMPLVNMTVLDVAPKILSTFDASLSDYTTAKFARNGINIRTGTSVLRVEPETIVLKSGEEVPYGLLVWATGLTQNKLVKEMLDVKKEPRSGRLLTDPFFRVYHEMPQLMAATEASSLLKEDVAAADKPKEMQVLEDVYAIGDCASIEGYDLPCTAQVAKQKAVYLSKVFNKHLPADSAGPTNANLPAPFVFKDVGALAYIGSWRAIARLQFTEERNVNKQGILAWFIWRSAYMTMSVSWRNKILIPVYWFLAYFFGRDISHLR